MADDALEDGEIAGELNSLPGSTAAEQVRDLPRTAIVKRHMIINFGTYSYFTCFSRQGMALDVLSYGTQEDPLSPSQPGANPVGATEGKRTPKKRKLANLAGAAVSALGSFVNVYGDNVSVDLPLSHKGRWSLQ